MRRHYELLVEDSDSIEAGRVLLFIYTSYGVPEQGAPVMMALRMGTLAVAGAGREVDAEEERRPDRQRLMPLWPHAALPYHNRPPLFFL